MSPKSQLPVRGSKTLDQFTKGATNPRAWMAYGDDLIAAAWLIFDTHFARWFGPDHPKTGRGIPIEFFNPFFLLAGFAVEAYVKGLRVYQLNKLKATIVAKDGRILHIATHDLVKLAKDAAIYVSLDFTERTLLQRLTIMTTWAGRYPVERVFSGEQHPNMLTSQDRPAIEAIVRRIRDAEREFWIVRRSDV
jgi:hypothetical protein